MADIRTVGVLNIAPDSFSDGGEHETVDRAVAHTAELFAAGATFVDIGAESTNPWSQPLTARTEIARLEKLIPELIKQFGPDKFSLDTYHPETLAWALDQGLRPVLNDVSGLHNPGMVSLVLQHNLRVVISHLPKSADGQPTRAHTNDAIDDMATVTNDLLSTAQHLEQRGLAQTNIILDPGIGFGKTMRLNWELLDFPRQAPEYAVMLGYSRKRFLHTTRQDKEIPEATALKNNAATSPGAQQAYETWLAQRHADILEYIKTASASSNQSIYLRLHQL